MVTDKLTADNRTRIPKRVRAALNLRRGDTLICSVECDGAQLTKLHTAHESVFNEWASEADTLAYRSL